MTQYAYYANDTLQAVTDPLGKVTSFTYFNDDMVQQKTDRLGRTSDYVYDKNARLVSEIWKDDQGATVDTRSFGYDVAGNLLTASNDAGAYSFTYDALNRVSTVNQPFGLSLTNVYDAADNRISVTDNKGGVTSSTYDGMNRLSSRETVRDRHHTAQSDLGLRCRGERLEANPADQWRHRRHHRH